MLVLLAKRYFSTRNYFKTTLVFWWGECESHLMSYKFKFNVKVLGSVIIY